MKTIKVSEATNTQLDWLVARALGYAVKLRDWQYITSALDPVEDADLIAFHRDKETVRVSAEQHPGAGWFPNKNYTTDWSQMGPIIEREGITVGPWDTSPAMAQPKGWPESGPRMVGKTKLIAAARCYVTSRLGETVEIPEELT